MTIISDVDVFIFVFVFDILHSQESVTTTLTLLTISSTVLTCVSEAFTKHGRPEEWNA